MPSPTTRRRFIAASGAAAALATAPAAAARPAMLGGTPVHDGKFPVWPVYDQTEEKALAEVVRSGAWFRGNGKKVDEFEAAYAQLTGAKACVTTVNGTNSLYTALNCMNVTAGDEVLLTAFTFVASFNVILRQHALPVFVDSDPDSFLMDPAAMQGLVNERTRAIMPVHIGGSCVDMDGVMAFANKHKLGVLEDACQAWIAQWRGRNVGRTGTAGCFSFQASKNLNSGEGGAIISDDEEFIDRCHSFHNQGRARRGPGYKISGSNLRLSEFQAAVLLAQMTRFEEQSRIRSANAAYLDSLLNEIPGIRPAKTYAGCTRNAYHIYMMHYDQSQFAGLPRAKFLKAMNAEGIPFGSGYTSHRNFEFLRELPKDRAFLKLFGEKRLREWADQSFNLPRFERVCQEHCWFSQRVLLSERSVMDRIAEAVRKVRQNAAELAKA